MKAEATGTKRRFPWLAAIGVLAIAGAAGLATAATGSGAPGCAAPGIGPRHWQPVQPYSIYLKIFGPALVTFLVGGYLALGVRRRWLRVIALLVVLIVMGTTTLLAMNSATFCGSLLPW